MQRLARVGRTQDYWVVNFGLHYSPSYREELEQLVGEARPLSVLFFLACTLRVSRSACAMRSGAGADLARQPRARLNERHVQGGSQWGQNWCRAAQVQRLRREGEFPQLVWKDTPPQHFETEFGEYPQEQPKPPMEVRAPCPALVAIP